MTDALELFELLGPDDQFEDLFGDKDKELIFDALVQFFDAVLDTIFLTFFKVLNDNWWIQYLSVFVAEQVE